MKKRIVYFLVASLSLGIIASCDVSVMPESSISDANFWNSEEDLRMAANYFYTTLPGLTSGDVTQDNWSTDAYPNTSGNSISDGSRTAPATSADYNYHNIYQANKLIEKAPEVIAKGADENKVNGYVGEARFLEHSIILRCLKDMEGSQL